MDTDHTVIMFHRTASPEFTDSNSSIYLLLEGCQDQTSAQSYLGTFGNSQWYLS